MDTATNPGLEAVIYWLLHPDRSYTPHELAIETVRRLREAEAAAGPRTAGRRTARVTAEIEEMERRVLNAATVEAARHYHERLDRLREK